MKKNKTNNGRIMHPFCSAFHLVRCSDHQQKSRNAIKCCNIPWTFPRVCILGWRCPLAYIYLQLLFSGVLMLQVSITLEETQWKRTSQLCWGRCHKLLGCGVHSREPLLQGYHSSPPPGTRFHKLPGSILVSQSTPSSGHQRPEHH